MARGKFPWWMVAGADIGSGPAAIRGGSVATGLAGPGAGAAVFVGTIAAYSAFGLVTAIIADHER
jgi:hypothetical protein